MTCPLGNKLQQPPGGGHMKRLMIGFVVWAAIGSAVYAQSGGLGRLKLSSGEYTVRPGNGDRISIHWEPNEPANKKKLEEMKKIKVTGRFDVHFDLLHLFQLFLFCRQR